jgi:hypothetical protein
VLVWINGAFGAGKTQTAFELHRRIPGSHVADPELIGFAIHRMLPAHARNDFQNRPQWRSAVVATLADAVHAHRSAASGPVIVPMTLVDEAYFDEIMAGLAGAGIDVRHFALIASPGTLHGRLRTRGAYWLGRAVGRQETWAMDQISRCVTALATDRFAEHIDTDERPSDDVVEDIAARAGLIVAEPRLTPVRYQLRRAAVGIRHIRV